MKTTQQDRCSGAVYHTWGTPQQDLLGNRRTKGVKQLNADLNNPIYSSLKTLAVPSGGVDSRQITETSFCLASPRLQGESSGLRRRTGNHRGRSDGRCHRPQHKKTPTIKNPSKTPGRLPHSSPVPPACPGGQQGRDGAGRAAAQARFPHFLQSGAEPRLGPGPSCRPGPELSLSLSRRSPAPSRWLSALKPSLLIPVLGKCWSPEAWEL